MPIRFGHRASKGARIGALTGLLLGGIYAFGGSLVDWTTTGLNAGTALAILALIGMPLLLAIPLGLAGWLADRYRPS
jgi:hypothetical protein